MRAALQLALTLIFFTNTVGCIAIGDAVVHVPPLSVDGEVVCITQGSEVPKSVYPQDITIVASSPYGLAHDFSALINGTYYDDTGCRKGVIQIGCTDHFYTTLKGEERTIGVLATFPPLFPPSKEEAKLRILFIFAEGWNSIYRVTLRGMSAALDETDLTEARDLCRIFIQNQKGFSGNQANPYEWIARQEWRLYSDVKWRSTEDVAVSALSRTAELDSITLKIKWPPTHRIEQRKN